MQEGLSFERKLTRRAAKHGLTMGQLGAHEIAVFRLGLGAQEKEGFKRAVRGLSADFVINSGFAGAVRTLLEPGDFVLAENFTSPELLKRLETVRLFEARGRFVCLEAIADVATKTRINSEGNVVAIDMESARIAAVCRKLAVPIVSARMISDRYDEGIPHVFLGKGIRQMKDLSDAIAFASRMIELRRRL